MKVVLITGAAGGLGWALARVLFARGDALGRTDVNATLLAEREQALGDPARVLAVAGDITGDAFRRALLAQARERFGRLDTLVNNAGITHRSLVARTDPAVFDKVMAVDWQAPLHPSCAALPLLTASRGGIVNIGSMAGWMPALGRAAARTRFFEVLRGEVQDQGQGIHVLNVYPSFLDTSIEHHALGGDGRPARHRRSMVGQMRSADWMAGLIGDAEARRRPWLFADRLSWFGSVLWRLWPSRYLKIMRKRFAVELAP